MSRLVKDFVEIRDIGSLDVLIERLIEVRDGLPEGAAPEVKLRGDDVFGRQLAVAYYRPQTLEEIECDARYAEAYRQSRAREAARQQELDGDSREQRHLRMVA